MHDPAFRARGVEGAEREHRETAGGAAEEACAVDVEFVQEPDDLGGEQSWSYSGVGRRRCGGPRHTGHVEGQDVIGRIGGEELGDCGEIVAVAFARGDEDDVVMA